MSFKRNNDGISSRRKMTVSNAIKAVKTVSFASNTDSHGRKTKNMIVADGALCCMAAPVICDGTTRSGKRASVCDGEKIYFSSGKDIFSVSEDGTFAVLGTNVLSGNGGKAYRYEGKTIFTDGDKLYSVNGASVAQENIYVPCIAKDCSYDGQTYTADEAINVLSGKADVRFGISYEATRRLPDHIRISSVDAIFLPDGTILPNDAYSVSTDNGGRAEITLDETTSRKLTVRVNLREIDRAVYADAASAFMGENPVCEVFSEDGAKKLIAFNGRKLYLLEMKGESYIRCDYASAETDDEITAILPYDDGWFVFTGSDIHRLEITDGAMTLYPFKRDFGCDIPRSAVSEKDKVIFANKTMGVYFVDRYGISDKDVSRKISANIEESFSAMTDEKKQSAEGVVACGKYWLFADGGVYIWDQMKKTPAASQNSEDDEKKLVWYEISGGAALTPIGAMGERIFFTGSGGTGYIVCRKAEGESLEGVFSSGRISTDFMGEKTTESISVNAKINGKSTMGVIIDGNITPYKFTFCGEGTEKTYTIRLPFRKFNSIGFDLRGSNMTIYGYEIRYYEG